MSDTSKVLLLILDGFGYAEATEHNAIYHAQKPFYDRLTQQYPPSYLHTHGHAVGLPEGVMGNSEVGHMTLGAGRVLYQDLTRISEAIASGTWDPILDQKAVLNTTQRIHYMGLMSDAGVHSTLSHLMALLDSASHAPIASIFLHLFTDGRDTPPDTAIHYLKLLQEKIELSATLKSKTHIASLMGRYFAMDRDNRWDRTSQTLDVLYGKTPATSQTPRELIKSYYAKNISDEFIPPSLLNPQGVLQPNDTVVFFNFRADRAKQLTQALSDPHFTHYPIPYRPKKFFTLTHVHSYVPSIFEPQSKENILAHVLTAHEKTSLRIAETEKYAHVTFFFNGGIEIPFPKEDRILIDSPRDVATYDLKAEMSAHAVIKTACEKLSQKSYDFVLINLANADMVGHTGNYQATIQAIETLDACLKKLIPTAQKHGYHILITADHGNAELMLDHHGKIHTQHTLNPVPFMWVPAPNTPWTHPRNGTLADVMPTICHLMGLPIPEQVTGVSLLPG